MAEKLEFDLGVKNNQLNKALDEGSKKAVNLEGVLETALGVLGGGLAIKAFDSLVGGFESLISIGKEAIDAAAGQEVATNNLNNALARSGNYSKEAAAELLEFAGAVQQTTIYEDDAVIANTALLESLTNLNKEGLKEGVTAAADFATVLGIDLETATRLVAKAAEGNVEAFKRYGVEIKKGETDAESFNNTIEALNKQFGGAATAQLNTYAGSLKAMGNAYGDLLEPVGDIIVKNPIVIGLFNEIRNVINETNEGVTTLVPSLQLLVQDGFFAASSAAQVFLDAMDGITVVTKGLINTFQIVNGALHLALVEPIKLIIDGLIFLGEKIPGIGDNFKNLENPLKDASDSLKSFTKDGIEGLANAADGNVFRSMSDGLNTFTNKVIDSAAAVKAANDAGKKNNEDRANNEKEVNADILAARAQLNADILTLQAQSAAEEAAFKEQLSAMDLEDATASNQAKIDAIYTQKIAEAQAAYEGTLLVNEATKKGKDLELANDKAFETLKLAAIKASGQKEIEEKKKINDAKKKSDEDYKNNLADTLATVATLQTSGNKTLIAIGKTAALAQIATSAPVAIAKAFELGPILGPIAAAAVGAAMAAQAAKVAGVQFANSGFIGGDGGATMGQDNTMAEVRKGEMILNGDDQKTLFNAIKSGNLGGGGVISIQIDGREIARAVRDQINQGFVLA